MSDIIYLYGFVPSGTELPSVGLLGVGGSEVELAELDGIAAVVSRVPAETYGAEALEARLDDLAWVGEEGLRHEQVVAWFVDHARILPVRLFTLFSSADALADDVRARSPELLERLRRIGTRREWDLKVAYDADRLADRLAEVSDAVAELDVHIAEAKPGKRFLLERKREEVARRETRTAANRLATGLLDALREHAVAAVALELPEKAAALPVVLSAALLVEREDEAALGDAVRERAAELGELGVDVDFSGPWAPYRFVREEGS